MLDLREADSLEVMGMSDDVAIRDAADVARATGRLGTVEVLLMLLVSASMVLATALRLWPISWVEVLGFVTGGVCVWLIVRENIWNWPIGLANNVTFFVLFWRGRLFADATLQLI